MKSAPWLGERAPDRAGRVIARLGPYLPILARQVAENMRLAGVCSERSVHDYFGWLGEHFAGALHVLRCAACEPESPSPAFLRLVHDRISIDSSLQSLRESIRPDRGAIILTPHINNYFMNVTRLNEEVPLTAYMRWVKDAKRQQAKEKWYHVSGADYISEPAESGGPLGRIKRMADVVNSGRSLVVLMDLTQKREDGIDARFFGREVYFPGGAVMLAIRTGAPVFVFTVRDTGRTQQIRLHGPYQADRSSGSRRELSQRLVQTFADHLADMIRESPGLWYLWGDKRWTRTWHGDPRYVRSLGPAADREACAAATEGH